MGKPVLNVYAASWCPHCRAAEAWLRENKIPFVRHEMEEQPPEIENKIIEVNGGDDWVVPTLEFNGAWRPGKTFDAEGLRRDLQKLGVPAPGEGR
jgi:mycoredoxin